MSDPFAEMDKIIADLRDLSADIGRIAEQAEKLYAPANDAAPEMGVVGNGDARRTPAAS